MHHTIAQQIGDFIEGVAPIESGSVGDELGFIYGNPDTPVRGVAVMWNAHTRSIQRAIDADCNVLIVHETLFFKPQASTWYEGPQAADDIVANPRRRALLDAHDMVVYRAHSNWDALRVDGVPDQAVKALGIEGLTEVAAQKYFRVHRLPAPMTVSELAACAQRGLAMPWVPRVFGDADKRIETFAWLIGGFGGNQLNMPQAAADLGAQCIIVGEMLEWITIEALECDMAVIETLHSLSEIPALKRQAEMIAAAFAETKVQYIDSGAVGW